MYEEKVAQLLIAIQNGANLEFRDGAFWPGPMEKWIPITIEEIYDESTESSDRR